MFKYFSILNIVALSILLNACAGQFGAQSLNPSKSETLRPYTEPHRPQYHFSPEKNWMNDPNGMFFYAGEYHLFYQHYPDGNVWGPMHWGHAVSKDMTHWEHLPIALYPDSLGYIFSGSAVVDWNNTSGFGRNGQPPIVAMFTYHNMAGEKSGRTDFQYQGIAYSNDKGRNWTKYEGNPVIPNTLKIRDFRDPKVVWHENSKQWLLVFAAYDHVMLWASKDLKTWRHLSDFGKEWGVHAGVWECPDLFQIPVENTTEKKWVLLQSLNPGGPNGGSGTQYFVGDFDGNNFILDPGFKTDVSNEKAVWLDYGRDNYAGVTWSDVPKQDGRRLFMGWMSNWDYGQKVPTTVWRNAMTLPRQLFLKHTEAGYRLFSQPVAELKKLRSNAVQIAGADISTVLDLSAGSGLSATLLELELEFEPAAGAPADFGIEVSNTKGEVYRVGYDTRTKQYYSDRTKAGPAAFSGKFSDKVNVAPRIVFDKKIRFHLFFDAASVEMFADDGATVMTDIFFPTEDFSRVKVYVSNGKVRLINGTGYQLKSIWK